ncbi:MAG: PSD1 and planctomycete cytochrome C domain-containing protein [Verrucomicrobia bacterium]|nr:PSD1 and planctomycete cytochrome C domain-containing protein [Verrucomicrobiota bacterium]
MIRVLIVFTLIVSSLTAGAAGKLRFNRDIRPLMSDTCFHCHGPDKNARKAGLRLDIREEALKPAKSGELPIVPGKPDQSEIIKRLFAEDKDDLMPPEEAHKTFTSAQKEMFKQWVTEGAEYEPHWAYTPLVRPPVPAVGTATNSSRNPIDAFIADKLAEKKITPSAEADRRTLLRRLSLDLIGLPPTPEEIQAFVSDQSPKAYENQVERFLKSPHFGERMAVWWLDVARFSDTVGFHGDQNQRIFPYRDYVIDSFNRNKPFNQFTLEQVAGDLLEAKNQEQRTTNLVASGFNRLNMMTREGGAQPKEYIAKYGAERVRTIGGAFLGATLGCCECHDHKFDPFTARDFYAMQAFFADVKQWGVYSPYGSSPNPELKGFNNEYPFPPEIEVESAYLKERASRIKAKMTGIASATQTQLLKDGNAKADFDKWRTSSHAFLKDNPTGWVAPKPEVKLSAATSVKAKGAPKADPKEKSKANALQPDAFVVQADGKILFSGAAGDDTSVIMQPPAGWVSAVRVELLPDASHKGSILRSGDHGSATLKLTSELLKSDAKKPEPLGFRYADANFKEPNYKSGAEIIGIKDAWKTSDMEWNQPHIAFCVFDKPVKINQGDKLTLRLTGNTAGCVRVSVSPFAPVSMVDHDWMASLKAALEKGDASARDVLLEAFLTGTGWNQSALKEYTAQFAELLECRGGRSWTLVTQAVEKPLTVRVLARGNWMDESGAIVEPASPEFLPTVFKPQNGKRLTRLDLAKWLCSKENPLTPRAFMNRLWKQFFGNGLSMIVDDLGAQGEPPSHPELLDWLAVEFRDSGWDVNHMIRLIVTSNTYRQSSSLRPELHDIDPNNRLLASQNPRRLDAEFVRDNALFISGLLNPDMGGPSVKPYQPEGYYTNIQFPDRNYVADHDDRQWRRGVYMHWQRTFLHPMLANFDAPMRDECTANRPNSNTPQQALTLLNDPTFVEAARVLAQRLLVDMKGDDTARIQSAFALALGRSAKDSEIASLTAFLKSQREAYRKNSGDADKIIRVGLAPVIENVDHIELAAWISLARVILNLQETITRY